MSKILILAATDLEIAPCRAMLAGRQIPVIVGGIGAVKTAIAVTEAVRNHNLDMIIQVGIAGANPNSDLELGDAVLVGSDFQADLGAWRTVEGQFIRFGDDQPIECQWLCLLPNIISWKIVSAQSVNTACTPLLRSISDIETMEGAAFFESAVRAGVSFLQLRAISNFVDSPRSEWEIDRALVSLADGLDTLLEGLGYVNS